MSQEQNDNNLGIDPDLANKDSLEYLKKLLELEEKQEKGLIRSDMKTDEDGLPRTPPRR